jgi:Domain of unknown function DUF29
MITGYSRAIANNFSLYEQDYNLWLETTINQLQTENFEQIDLINLIEELASMGRSDKRALESNLRVLLLHLLKYSYQPKKRSKSWLSSIIEHRIRIKKTLKESPSLNGYYAVVFDECYHNACQLAAVETGLSIDTFPSNCPFNQEEILIYNFLP